MKSKNSIGNSVVENDAPQYAEAADGFVRALCGVGGWVHARDLAVLLYGEGSEKAMREVRALASAMPFVLSGDKGYILVEYATADEQRHAVARLRSQARDMMRRARESEAEACA